MPPSSFYNNLLSFIVTRPTLFTMSLKVKSPSKRLMIFITNSHCWNRFTNFKLILYWRRKKNHLVFSVIVRLGVSPLPFPLFWFSLISCSEKTNRKEHFSGKLSYYWNFTLNWRLLSHLHPSMIHLPSDHIDKLSRLKRTITKTHKFSLNNFFFHYSLNSSLDNRSRIFNAIGYLNRFVWVNNLSRD